MSAQQCWRAALIRQFYLSIGWVIWSVKLSPKWPINNVSSGTLNSSIPYHTVCVPIHLSGTFWYCIKTALHIIILCSAYGSPIILVFPLLNIFAKFQQCPLWRCRLQVGYMNFVIFSQIGHNQGCYKCFLPMKSYHRSHENYSTLKFMLPASVVLPSWFLLLLLCVYCRCTICLR